MAMLEDLTFIIPVKIDSSDRARNLRTVLKYLLQNTNSPIRLVEQNGNAAQMIMTEIHDPQQRLSYQQISDKKINFHRTRYINLAVKTITTDYLSVYDADVLLHPHQYIEAMDLLHDGYDVVYPFDGYFHQIYKPAQLALITNTLDLGAIDKHQCSVYPNAGQPLSVGAAIFFRREAFLNGGMENEHFIAWGPEDQELFHRFTILGFKITRVQSDGVYHLEHSRSLDSSEYHAFINNNREEFMLVKNMDEEHLRNYMLKWEWLSSP
jgi:predicted glycosyltransferase involved in capsule biosynthesis